MGTTPAPTTAHQAGLRAAPGLNQAIIVGQMVAEPEHRTLPSGSLATSFSLTVRSPGQKTTSVPIVWYDPPQRLSSWKVGEMAVVRGTVVRRFYRSADGLGSSTEVVVDQAHLLRHEAKTCRVLAKAQAALNDVSNGEA